MVFKVVRGVKAALQRRMQGSVNTEQNRDLLTAAERNSGFSNQNENITDVPTLIFCRHHHHHQGRVGTFALALPMPYLASGDSQTFSRTDMSSQH